MIKAINTEHTLAYQHHILQSMSTGAPIKKVAYFGVGVGGTRFETGAQDGYAIQTPHRANLDLYLPIPVKVVNLNKESGVEQVSSEYVGVEDKTIQGTPYRLYWYKKLIFTAPTYVNINETERVVVTTPTTEMDNLATVSKATMEILGKDAIPALWTYVHDVYSETHPDLQLPLAISEIGIYANNNLLPADIGKTQCSANHILVRHDCIYPLNIPGLSTSLQRECEFMLGHSPLMIK